MNQNVLLQQAKQGNLKSIAVLMNRSLESKGLRSTIDSPVSGQLDITLDAPQVPNLEAAEYIFRGLQKLQPQTIYEAVVYGRQQGKLFASWSHRYILQERPSDWVPDVSESVVETPNSYPVAVQLEDGKTLKLDLVQLMGFGGVICLLIGLFSPIVSFGALSVTFFQQGSYEGILLLILAVASAILLAKRNFVWLWATAANAGLLVVLSFLGRLHLIQEAKSKLATEMAGNPFRGLADLAMQSLQLQWGWIFLIGGAALLQVALLMRSRRPPREAYIATLVVLGLVITSVLATPTMQSVAAGDTATKARQSEAKQYVGSLMRSQQAHFLEHDKFADSITDLNSVVASESDNYNYSIETQSSMAYIPQVETVQSMKP
jgi:Type IV pilin-like G and H, putative